MDLFSNYKILRFTSPYFKIMQKHDILFISDICKVPPTFTSYERKEQQPMYTNSINQLRFILYKTLIHLRHSM